MTQLFISNVEIISNTEIMVHYWTWPEKIPWNVIPYHDSAIYPCKITYIYFTSWFSKWWNVVIIFSYVYTSNESKCNFIFTNSKLDVYQKNATINFSDIRNLILKQRPLHSLGLIFPKLKLIKKGPKIYIPSGFYLHVKFSRIEFLYL